MTDTTPSGRPDTPSAASYLHEQRTVACRDCGKTWQTSARTVKRCPECQAAHRARREQRSYEKRKKKRAG
jgi:hypothetical protein